MHPNHEHAIRAVTDPQAVLAQRLEVGRQSGVPQSALDRFAERMAQQKTGPGVARVVEPDRQLVDGVEIDTDLGPWTVYETPGHAPSHVCLYQPDHRVLISGDHVLGRISLFYDYGWTPDPVGEFLTSLDVVDRLDARLGLSGHGRPFVDVHGHIEGSRQLVRERLTATVSALNAEPKQAVAIASDVHDGQPLTEANASWFLQETLCYLQHLERSGQVVGEADGDTVRWRRG
jgi:glyoxylase-like metal-dependent hydrolase (beta-lactamase superfamily II)